MKIVLLTLSLLSCMVMTSSVLAEGQNKSSEWITLGTMAGPLPNAFRSQPANALIANGHTYLVDVGDGAVGRLATAGYTMKSVKAVFISHLHFDHTGGLPALISLRWQTNAPGTLTVYGPPGTKQMVEGIFQFMAYGAEGAYGVPGRVAPPASNNVEVVELADGDVVKLDDFTLTAVRNSHYSWPKGSEEWKKFVSLAYRFDLKDRSIVFTGDTGPSEAIEKLAKDVDMLVSEMMDIEHTVALVKRLNPNMKKLAFEGLRRHLSSHHVTPEQVGQMAKRANVKQVVVTHMAPALFQPTEVEYYRRRVAAEYDGQVYMADDLDRF